MLEGDKHYGGKIGQDERAVWEGLQSLGRTYREGDILAKNKKVINSYLFIFGKSLPGRGLEAGSIPGVFRVMSSGQCDWKRLGAGRVGGGIGRGNG